MRKCIWTFDPMLNVLKESQSQSFLHRVNGALQTDSSYLKPRRFIVGLKVAQETLCFYDS